MKLLASLGVIVAVAATAFGAKPPEVEFFVEGDSLQPSSTIEVRFARAMVAREDVGVTSPEPPLVLAPVLPGKFTWLSTRSGVYVPSAPPALGTSYQVTLRRGLQDAGGAAVAAKFSKALKTPPFQVSAGMDAGDKESYTQPKAELKVAFNLNVKLAGTEKFFEFVADDGRRIAAEVRYAKPQDYFQIPAEAEDWNERWQLAHEPASPGSGAPMRRGFRGRPGDAEGDEDRPRMNRLIVSPVALLTPGPTWRLEMKPGIEAAEGGLKLEQRRVAVLGKVWPLIIERLSADSYLNSGRSVTIKFSDQLAPDVSVKTAGKFFRVTPEPPHLRFEEGWEEITIRADFERDVDYRVELDPSLLGNSGLPFMGPRMRVFRFEPVKPRVYLPKITADQLRGGERKFPVHTVNLQSLRITAQLVAPGAAAQAIAAFEKYEKEEAPSDDAPYEPYQPIKPGMIKATPLAGRTVDLPGATLDTKQETVVDWSELLGGQKAGLIFLTVEGQPLAAAGRSKTRPAAQALVQLTDLGVLWKRADQHLRATIFSMASAQPIDGAKVDVVKKDGATILATATTDAAGAALLPLKDEIGWLVASKGDDVHALRMGEDVQELPMARFNLPISYGSWNTKQAQPPEMRGLLFTDRPLYRPGETVHVKGLIRTVKDGGLIPGPPGQGVLALSHPQGERTFFRQEGTGEKIDVQVDERGAFDASFVLPPIKVGTSSVSFSLGQERAFLYTSFQVQEFQPNAFETRIAMPATFTPEQKVAAEVSANYFFGSPVSDARVQWTLQYIPESFQPGGFTDFRFGDSHEPDYRSLTLRGEGTLARALAIEPQLPAVAGERQHGLLTVEVTDQNQQTVTESREFDREASTFYLGIDQSDWEFLKPGEEFVAKAVAVRPDGTPVPEPVPVKAELLRVEHETVRVQAAGKAVSFQTETRETVIATAGGKTLMPIHDEDKWRVPDGETVRFKPGAAGDYALRLTAQDGAGHEVRARSSILVSGREAFAWDYHNPAQINLVADKAEYHPGDTARILLKTPISGEAWVSIERGDRILRSLRVKVEGNAPILEIPLEPGDAPNVFVSAVLLRGAEQSTRKFKTADFRYGLCRLQVVNPMTRLQVSITPARSAVQPGQEVEAEVRVLGPQGAPVADAEVTFFAADDGILALTGYERPQPNRIFEAMFPLNISTGLTLFDLFPEDPSDLTFANKGYLIGGGGLEGPAPRLRHDFPGTACWFPALRTDREGRVKPRFTAPDALTRYRLVAVAHAGDDRFGSGESAIGIRQPLMLLSALGPAANVGDEIVARAVVRNETGERGTAEVALELDAKAQPVQGALTAQVALENSEARTVDFPVKLVATGDAGWRWSAHMAAKGQVFDDRMAVTIKIGSPVPVLRETYLTELAGKTNDLLAGVNPQVLEGEGAVTVTLANTRLAGLRECATELLEYPYGCAEQLVSALIPYVVVKKLGPVLGDLGKDPDTLRRTIEASVEKIFALQTPSGGLAYWPGGQRPDLFPSAWAAVAFSELQKQGFALPAGWEKLLEYLTGELRGLDKVRGSDALEERALTLFALAGAGRGEPAYFEKLAERRKELTAESRALLALAILESKGRPASAERLLDPKLPALEIESWFGSATRERAIGLMAWTRLDPKAREVGRLTQELLASRKGGHWRTTQENAWALLALSRYFALVEGGVRPVSGTLVQKAGATPFELTKQQLSETTRVAFDAAHPPAPLGVENPAGAPLYGEARFVARPPVADQPRQDRGYAVSRSYRKFAADGALADATDLRVGDRVVVTLRVATARPGHFVAIDDPLPAILEALNPEFRTQQAGVGAEDLWAADYREVRADRVLYFCDHLPAGTYTFSYLARVRAAGMVMAPAAKVEEMYRPERFGLSETARLASLPAR